MRNITLIILIMIPCLLYGQDAYFKWGKTINSSGHEYIIYTEDRSGNYYAAIVVTPFDGNGVDIDPGPGTYVAAPVPNSSQSYICKLDKDMNLIWAKPFNGIPLSAKYENYSIDPDMIIHHVELDNDSNIIIAGKFTGVYDFDPGPGISYLSDDGWEKTFLCKLDKNGNLIWAKKYYTSEYCIIKDIAIDSDNNIIVYSNFRGNVDVDRWPYSYILSGSPGYGDLYIFKVNFWGKVQWGYVIGGKWSDYAGQVKVDENDDLYFTGTFDTPVDFDPGPDSFIVIPVPDANWGTMNTFLLKLNKNGQFKWVQNYFNTSIDEFNVSKDDIFLCGVFYKSMDFNIGAGDSILDPVNGNIFLSKIDTAGNFNWVKQFGEGHQLSLAMDSSGNFYLSGTFKGKVDFDPGPGTEYLTAPTFYSWQDDKYDIFLMKLDSTFNLMWLKQVKSEDDIRYSNISVHKSGDVLVSGSYNGTADLNPDDSIQYNVLSKGLYDFFLLQLSETKPVGVRVVVSNNSKIYPNPTSGKIYIDYTSKDELNISIYDITGKAISKKVIYTSGKAELEIEGNPGIYFIEVLTEKGERQVFKVIKL